MSMVLPAMAEYEPMLVAAAALNAIASLLHVAVIVGGPRWYRFFGAGERMVTAAQRGKRYPALVTGAIALVLVACAAYALSGAGVLPRLPLLWPALWTITAVYLLRGLAVVPMAIRQGGRLSPFWYWSSAICLLYGSVHLAGVLRIGPAL